MGVLAAEVNLKATNSTLLSDQPNSFRASQLSEVEGYSNRSLSRRRRSGAGSVATREDGKASGLLVNASDGGVDRDRTVSLY